MIKKIVSLLFTVILLCSVLSVCTFAASEPKAVYDLADMFTDAEREQMEAAAQKYFKDTSCNVYIVTAKSSNGEVNYWGDHFVAEHLNGKEGNSVILIITDNADRNYDIYTYGKCDRRISNSEIDEILDEPKVYDNIKGAKNYAEAATEFIYLSAMACEPKLGLAIVLALAFATAASVITGVCIVSSYKKKSRSDKYPLNQFANMDMTDSRDIFAGSFVTKRVISQSSGGRSGGSFGGGGGGGGHRGGR